MMKLIPMATLAITAGLFLVPGGAQQVTPKAPEHTMPMPQSGGVMNYDKMMADMKVADPRRFSVLRADGCVILPSITSLCQTAGTNTHA
jgi:hypothetical protein